MKKVVLLAILALILVVPAADATSYVMMADEDLADDAHAIVRGRVVEAAVIGVGGTPYTEYLLEVEEEVLGASVGERIRVRVLGGTLPDGTGLKIWGVPELAVGQSAIAFLVRDERGEWAFEQLALGAFRIGHTADGREVAVRDLVGATEVQMDTPHRRLRGDSLRQAHLPRDAAAFTAWLRDRVGGTDRAPDYFLGENDRPVQDARQAFTLLQDSGTGRNIHWTEFTTPGNSLAWFMYKKGQKGLGKKGLNSIKAALTAWSKIFNITLAYGGKNNATAAFTSFDGINTIAFNDPANNITGSFDCSSGGVLAIGGPWFNSAVLDGAFIVAQGADIVFQDNLQCFFAASPARDGAFKKGDKAAEEIAAHELGHTLGLGHSCESPEFPCKKAKFDKALMRWAVHNDGRGAKIEKDDKKGIKKLGYNGG